MAYLGYMLSHRRHPMPVKKDERPCSSAKERLEILAYSFGRLVADCDSTATRVKSRARHRTYRSVPLLSPSNASLLKQARIKRAEWVGSMAVAHSGPAPSLRHADFGSNSDSSIGTVVDSSHDVEAAPSKKSEQDINSSDEKSAGRDAMREKPVMPRAKRVISFDDQTSRLSRSKLVIVFLGLSFTIFLSLADQVTVATAEPVIGKALEAGESIAWVGTSYLIANTSTQLIYGRLSDIFGRKLCLLVAIGLLVVGNLICGFSNSPAMLYVFRSIAGMGGGGMTNLSMVIVSDVVTLEERGKWQGILSAGAAAGSAAGPFIGAALSQNVSWRWTFWIMCPCGVVCAAVIFFCLPLTPVTGSAKEKLKKVDYYGAILSLAANIFILIPISSGGTTYSWSSPTVIVLLIIGIMTAIAFIIVEWKVAPLPVMPLRLWTYRTTAITLGTTFFIGMIYFSNLFFLPIYFQVLRGMSPIKSASFLLSLLLVQVCSSLLAGIITPYTKKVLPQVRVGFFIWTIGAGLQTTFNRQTSYAKLVGYLIFQGFGVGCTLQTTLVAAQAGAPNKDRACVTGTRNCLRFMGGAFGLAICNAILNNVVKARLPPGIPEDVRHVIIHQISPDLPKSLDPAVIDAIYDVYQDALHYIFIFFVPVAGTAFLLSLVTKENPLNRDYVDPKQKKIEDSQVSSVNQQTELESGQISSRTLTPGSDPDNKVQ